MKFSQLNTAKERTNGKVSTLISDIAASGGFYPLGLITNELSIDGDMRFPKLDIKLKLVYLFTTFNIVLKLITSINILHLINFFYNLLATSTYLKNEKNRYVSRT